MGNVKGPCLEVIHITSTSLGLYWLQLPARKAGQCSLAACPRREGFGDNTATDATGIQAGK